MSNPKPVKAPPAKPVERAEQFSSEAVEGGASPLSLLFSSRERPCTFVTFPGCDESDENARVAIIALSDHQLLDARIDAFNFITKVKKLEDWVMATEDGQNILGNEVQVQVLWRALRKGSQVAAPFASTANELRMYLEPDERAYLWNEYLTFQAKRSPIRSLQSEEEVEEVVSALGKDSLPHAALSYYDSPSLRNIIISLADRLAKLMKQHSSDT